jgi:glycosyltransferase involved in cell wall biosynthesis
MFTSSFLPTIGGLQFQVKWLAEEIARQGEEVYLLTPKDAGKYIDKQQNDLPKNVDLNFDTSSVRVKRYLCNTLKLLKAINKIKPDIIHVHCALPDGLYMVLAKFLQKTPLVITSHGADVVKIKEISYGYRLNPIYSLIIRSVLQLCDTHVLVSDAMIKYAHDAGSSNDKIAVIPNGIPPRKFVSEEKVNEVREKYGISPDEKILLTLSGMRPMKGLKYLLRAMPEILEENPNTRLIMAAKGRYMTYLKSLISNLNMRHGVKFLGFVHEEEKIALIKLCDIFCLPSVFEPFGIVLLEAMQFEKSIVASNAGGPPEVIENEKNGLLVPPKSPEAISKAINLLLADENLRTKLGKEASKHVKTFDIKNIAKKYISLYRETIKCARVRRHRT